MELHQLQHLDTLHMRQRVTLMVNRYEIYADNGRGGEGELVAVAEQRRAKLREEVSLFADRDKRHFIAGFKARDVLDFAAKYDVNDVDGAQLGVFRKDFGKSLVRSTWHLEQPGRGEVRGQERSRAVAIVRRLWEFVPLLENVPFVVPYHFDFDADGTHVLSVRKKIALRDRYVVSISDPTMDRRLIMAQAVALDALQSR